MNQMAAMMAQMNKMKRDLRKAQEELAAKEPSVIISRRPCALLKYAYIEQPSFVSHIFCWY